MQRPRSPRPEDLLADDGPVLDRRRFLTFAALGTGAAVSSFGLAKVVLGRDAATASASSSSGAAVSGAGASGASTTSTAATATAVADELAYGMGDVSAEHLTITVADGYRTIVTASYPDHDIDASFRYPGTPQPQDPGDTFRVTTDPQVASSPTYVGTGQYFGVHLDSVVFDPKTAGYWNNDMGSGWNYVATPDQLDAYGAHTRPETGFYHYHAVTAQWVSDTDVHSALVGWAADGFPIYLRYGYTDPTDAGSGVTNLASSYRLKSGDRPSDSPGGTYDGTFVADYEYVDGLGDLDECNGRDCVTPEFPDGTYAYFLTDEWPWVPTYLRGTPDDSFSPGPGGAGGGAGQPPGA
ncbi:MAG: YHYH protein [Acidimicrobiales bacterium]|nr:YHYH protein [Acidimicrobiales bacterium]MCB1017670.1 YHYH protein [Acidimicrobiales bacterium]MCB9373594.1 YHYH protein [Microthrixaceae bacterium]